MSRAETVQRTKLKNDICAHFESLYRTSLWLTMRGSLARDLTVRTITSAYREWHTSKVLLSNKTHLFRVLARECSATGGKRHTEYQTGKFLSENNNHIADSESGSLRHSVSETESMRQLLQRDVSAACVKGTIARFRPNARLIMILHYRENFTYEEIAYITDLSKMTVRTILARLRKLIPGYILENSEHSHGKAVSKSVFQIVNATSGYAVDNVSSTLLFNYNRRNKSDVSFQRWENEGGAVIR
jgi:DNA-directed RNA polymerase specialized sigma24 family protein